MARHKGETALYVIPRKVRHIMRRGVLTIQPSDTAAKAAGLMGRRKIGALPVVKGSKLVGIITATDILLAFSRMKTGGPQAQAKAKTRPRLSSVEGGRR